jgi:ribosomal protein S18 acetylase RimI-like enzyme
MKVRSYADGDWEAVREIYNLAKVDELKGSVDLRAFIPLEKDPRSQRLFGESRIVVVEEGGTLLGFGGNSGNYISWLFVHPLHRRRGVARMILNHILDHLKESATLNVFKNNRAARALYDQFGFEIEREFTGNLNGFQTRAMTLRRYKSGHV